MDTKQMILLRIFRALIRANGLQRGETLIFFDELQAFPEISTALKFFYIDGRFDVICSGSMLDEEAQDDLRANKNMDVYKGALYENIVGEALVKSDYKLYYYKREDSTLEEDFFVRTASDLVPVEVKATNGRAISEIQMMPA